MTQQPGIIDEWRRTVRQYDGLQIWIQHGYMRNGQQSRVDVIASAENITGTDRIFLGYQFEKKEK